MSEPTEADRRTADGLVAFYRGLRKGGVEDPADTGDLAAAIARALAAERAKARAPFLALADDLDGDFEIHGFAVAEDIRRAAEDPS